MSGASLWNPGASTVSINADFTAKKQLFTATPGQTVFNLTVFEYVPGTESLLVFINGEITTGYTETDEDTVTLNSGAANGDQVLVIGFVGITGTVGTLTGAAFTHASLYTQGTLGFKMKNDIDITDAPYLAVGDGVASCAAAIEDATNAAANLGKRVWFPKPASSYLVDRPLVITARSYYWAGERPDRGLNAYVQQGPEYAASVIKYRPAALGSPIVFRSDPTAPYTDIIGPFIHQNFTFDMETMGQGFKFGDENLGAVSDVGGEKYVFGVRFDGCAFSGGQPTGGYESDGTGAINMGSHNQIFIHLTKCFDWSITDTSFAYGYGHVRTFGCDKGSISNFSNSRGFIPYSFNGSGSFTVPPTMGSGKIDGFYICPIQSINCQFVASNYSFENNTPIAGGGKVNLTTAYGYTANVVAGGNVLAFSANMENKIFPYLTVLEISDGTNTDYVYPISVVGVMVTIASDSFKLTWTSALASVIRYHGYGPLHYSNFGAAHSNVIGFCNPNCPLFVYVGSYGNMAISNAVTNNVNNCNAIVIANQLDSAQRLNNQMTFTGCSANVVADPSHPLVYVDNWRENHGMTINGNQQIRMPTGTFDGAESKINRKWVFGAKEGGWTTGNNQHKDLTFKKVAGDTNTDQHVWAWYIPAADYLECTDETLPSAIDGGLKVLFRVRSVNANDAVDIWAAGSAVGKINATTIAISNTWKTYELDLPSIPTQWTGVRVTTPSLQIGGATGAIYIEAVELIELPPKHDSYVSNGAIVTRAAGRVTMAPAVATRICTLKLNEFYTGQAVSGKIKVRASDITAGAEGYDAAYAEWSVHATKNGGVIAVLGAPAALVANTVSINAANRTIAIAITTAVVGNNVEIRCTLTAGGATPGTNYAVTYELEVQSDSNLMVSHA